MLIKDTTVQTLYVPSMALNLKLDKPAACHDWSITGWGRGLAKGQFNACPSIIAAVSLLLLHQCLHCSPASLHYFYFVSLVKIQFTLNQAAGQKKSNIANEDAN